MKNTIRIALFATLALVIGVAATTRTRSRDCPDLSGCTLNPYDSSVSHDEAVGNDAYVHRYLMVGPSNETFLSAGSITTPGYIVTSSYLQADSIYANYKYFKIDHPSDPANKYLLHSSVESSEMKNMYDGVVTLDAAGTAWVYLPTWFSDLNGDFRYQLTAMGRPGVNLHIAQEIAGNKFRIAGGTPQLKVSWQVTGIRHDRGALSRRRSIEEEKAPSDRGHYLDPTAFNQPVSASIFRHEGLQLQPPARSRNAHKSDGSR